MTSTVYLNSCQFNLQKRHGFTLIEVVAGLALLGTLLAAVTMAKGKYTRQTAVAERQLQAIKLTDRWIAEKWQDQESLLIPGQGELSPDGYFTWQTTVELDIIKTPVQVARVRLEVFDKQDRSKNKDEPICTVELLISQPEKEDEADKEQYRNSIQTDE